MLKSDILTLVSTLSLGRSDSSLSTQYLEEALARLGDISDTLCDVQQQACVAGTATYTLHATHQRVLLVFHDDYQLADVKMSDLQLYASWKQKRGTPIAYTTAEQTGGTFLVYPTPNTTSSSLVGLTTPLGTQFPQNALSVLSSKVPGAADFIPEWLGLPLALWVCAMEFAHRSDHQDAEWAIACAQAATLFFRKAGIVW